MNKQWERDVITVNCALDFSFAKYTKLRCIQCSYNNQCGKQSLHDNAGDAPTS